MLLASLATLAFGAVLGPEAPLIAMGSGLGVLAVRLAARDSPPMVAVVMSTTGSFAAVSALFGSPLLGAFLLLEAAGIGGPMLGLVLVPGLLAAGLGALVFLGLDSLTGFGTLSLTIPGLPPFDGSRAPTSATRSPSGSSRRSSAAASRCWRSRCARGSSRAWCC